MFLLSDLDAMNNQLFFYPLKLKIVILLLNAKYNILMTNNLYFKSRTVSNNRGSDSHNIQYHAHSPDEKADFIIHWSNRSFLCQCLGRLWEGGAYLIGVLIIKKKNSTQWGSQHLLEWG